MTDTKELVERMRKGIEAEPFLLGTHSDALAALSELETLLNVAARDRDEFIAHHAAAEKALLTAERERDEARALEQQARMGWNESRRREKELRGRVAELEEALREMTECPNIDAPYHSTVNCNFCSAAPVRRSRAALDKTTRQGGVGD